MASNGDQVNSDELETPKWLNDDFLATVLRNCEPNSTDLEVNSFEVSPASGKGDHFASVMFRSNVEYRVNNENKKRSLIIKAMPELEGQKKDMFSDSHIFETEIGMYAEVLQRFTRILRDAGDDTVLQPTCLYHALRPRKVIVFEDIVPQGYSVLRDRVATKEEIQAAYTKLAKWHAISYKLLLEEPKYFDQFRHSAFSTPNWVQDPGITDGNKIFIEAYKSEPRLSKYMPYFEKIEPILLKKTVESTVEYRENARPDAYYVLGHGDFHSKNLMFKHCKKTGKFEDVLLLDFQFCYVAPIALDLVYSIYLLLDDETRDDLDEYLSHFLTTFNETLSKIGCNGPLHEMERIREQMKQHKYFELFLVSTFLPTWYALKNGSVDLADILSSPEYRTNLYKSDFIIKGMERVLQNLEKQNYFNDLEHF